MALLYHLGLMQWLIRGMAWIMRKTIGLANYHLHEVLNYEAEIYIKGTALLEKMPIRYYGHQPLCGASHRIAMESGLSGYDAIFLALAQDRGAVLYSADEKLIAEAARRGLAPCGR